MFCTFQFFTKLNSYNNISLFLFGFNFSVISLIFILLLKMVLLIYAYLLRPWAILLYLLLGIKRSSQGIYCFLKYRPLVKMWNPFNYFLVASVRSDSKIAFLLRFRNLLFILKKLMTAKTLSEIWQTDFYYRKQEAFEYPESIFLLSTSLFRTQQHPATSFSS